MFAFVQHVECAHTIFAHQCKGDLIVVAILHYMSTCLFFMSMWCYVCIGIDVIIDITIGLKLCQSLELSG